MKKFSQFLDRSGLNEWLTRHDVVETPLVEAKLSRVFQYVEDDKRDFGIVSAYRGEKTKEENLKLHDELKAQVRKMGYGYIELRGGYREESGNVVEELSLLVPNVKKTQIVQLGRQYEQHSVMYKNQEDFFYIGTNDASGIGKVLMRFRKGEGQNNLELAKHKVIDFFSQIKKGPHSDKKFVFNVKDTPEVPGKAGESQEDHHAAASHKAGDVWQTSSGLWGAKSKEGKFEYFDDKESAAKYAKKSRGGYKIQEREEWGFAQAAYLRRGEQPKWITIFEDSAAENS